MHALWDRFETEGRDLTVTFGEIATDPAQHGFSKVPGQLHLCLDMRSAEAETLALAEDHLRAIAGRIEAEIRTGIDIGPRTDSAPVRLSDRLRSCLSEAAAGLGIATRALPSGAGHDAATYADAGVPAAMLFIRNRNGSHTPEEAMDMGDFEAALSVLRAALFDPRLIAERACVAA
jgi:N-carbamoyl-L-amino-acid hydrolase